MQGNFKAYKNYDFIYHFLEGEFFYFETPKDLLSKKIRHILEGGPLIEHMGTGEIDK